MEKENLIYKRIVVISEAVLNNAATGMAQTLANLFDNYPSGYLLFCSPVKSSGRLKKIKTIPYKGMLLSRGIFKKIIPLSLRNYWFEKIKIPSTIKKILAFDPQIVLISNLAYDSCLITLSLLQQKKLPLCVYLMDYISKENENTFDLLIEPLMKKADKHIFISKYMAQHGIANYPNIKDWIVMHNPVEEKEIASVAHVSRARKEISFAYAGSLWQMHLDAVLLFAEALGMLRKKGFRVSLVIYTIPYFYKLNKRSFDDLEIIYGGFYRVDLLKPQLLKQTALLVASSFDEKYFDLSAYSVQTKVTDYLACGVPVIGIGPAYSACNKFLKENDCGFIIESDKAALIAEQIEKYLGRDTDCTEKEVSNGLTLIRENYKKDFVQKKLYHFLSA